MRMEGKTEKQKNQLPRNQLSWAAWVIARLGGWKGYQSQKSHNNEKRTIQLAPRPFPLRLP